MKSPIYAALLICGATLAPSPAFAQLKLIQRVEVPGDSDKFDHFGVDLKHGRLFATPESTNSLEVFDIRTGKHIRTIAGIGEGHSVLYREDLNRIYMADGGGDGKGPGAVQIIDGASYALLKTVPLLPDADNFAYDPATHHLYVTNGGKDAKLNYVIITEIATDTGEKVGEIKVSGDTVEAMALESGSRRMYANNAAMNIVEVIDRDQRKIVESWPLTLARTNVAMALDEANHRLFLGCRDGHLLVMDTRTGQELQALPITKGKTDDHFQTVETTPLAKTARLVPELNRYFVASPKQSGSKAEVLIFEVQ